MITVREDTLESMMKSLCGERPALQSAHVEGRLDGMLLSTVIRQNYHNHTEKNLEIVYTFPLGWGSSLLGLDAEIGGKRLQGVVVEKKQAEKQYEEANDEGDTPVMVQESSPGLYTANLGNIKAGESIGVEIRCAQLLRFEQGQIRVKIPTVIAPRYGDAHKEGGLAPHETDKVDLGAKYPLTIRLNITGEAAKAKITCPSHKTAITTTENGVSVALESGAMLDRDFILLLQGLAGHSFALSVPDEEAHTVLASFCPK
ncbi:MAG: VWA domain-containing protein, partial [Deltaproteobacteria bacterium]|nr:VWA domain-containing protein [Deltaproteobacteria bacterium]